MRQVIKIAIAATAAFALAACSSAAPTPAASGSSAPASSSAAAPALKVGMAYDVGGRGDQSFNDSAAAGL
ncbi:MAG TPA: BMP family ABC transporter substrate-binding protein, partial [Propionicimonas sp.]